jgi:hypothetical protein
LGLSGHFAGLDFLRTGSWSTLDCRFRRGFSFFLIKLSPQLGGGGFVVDLKISNIEITIFGVFHELKEAFFEENISFEGVDEKEFQRNILEILFFVFFLEVFFEFSFLSFGYKHKILGLDILVNHLDLILGPLI